MGWFLLLIVGFVATMLLLIQRGRRRDDPDGLREDLRRRLLLEHSIRRQAKATSMSRDDYVDTETARLVADVEQRIGRRARAGGVVTGLVLPPVLTLLALQLGSTDSIAWGLAVLTPLGLAAAWCVYRLLLTDPGVRAGTMERHVRARLGRR